MIHLARQLSLFLLCALVPWVAYSDGLPSRPKFQSVGVGTSAPSTGGVVIASPSSGIALTVNGVNSAATAHFTSAFGAAGVGNDLEIFRNGTTLNAVGQGANLTLQDSSATTATTIQQAGGQTEIWQYNAGWSQVLKFDSSRNLFVNGVNITPSTGSFTATIATGCTTTPTATFNYAKNGNVVTLEMNDPGCTSNSTQYTITGLPAYLSPSGHNVSFLLGCGTDNGAKVSTVVGLISSGTTTITLYLNGSATGWTASGGKGFLCVNSFQATYRV